MRPPRPREALIARSRHSSFKTGSMPGRPKSTKFAWVFGSIRFVQRAAKLAKLKKKALTWKHFVLSLHLHVEFEAYLQLPGLHQSLKIFLAFETVFGRLFLSCVILGKIYSRILFNRNSTTEYSVWHQLEGTYTWHHHCHHCALHGLVLSLQLKHLVSNWI